MADYFSEVQKIIQFEGADSKNPLAFKYYDADALVAGKSMADHLRFSVAYWHSFKGDGQDMFGAGTFDRPWNDAGDSLKQAEQTLDAAFEFFTKLGVGYYCFHDR
ncbi:MAG: xylose isomerase, partial [Deltaproteobacteria bacterium]|nr:xylose isomerase [Deltaproteobacteria bacterium]